MSSFKHELRLHSTPPVLAYLVIGISEGSVSNPSARETTGTWQVQFFELFRSSLVLAYMKHYVLHRNNVGAAVLRNSSRSNSQRGNVPIRIAPNE